MKFIDRHITIEQAAEIVFDLIPAEVLKEHEKTMTKEKFIHEYKSEGMTHTKFFSKEEIEIMSLYLLSEWKQSKESLSPGQFAFLIF